jgi:hypothetical protein
MFTIYLWDANYYDDEDKLTRAVEKMPQAKNKNEFLIQTNVLQFPILSELSFCDELLLNAEQLVNLKGELNSLLESLGENDKAYVQELILFIQKAFELRLWVLFSPF